MDQLTDLLVQLAILVIPVLGGFIVALLRAKTAAVQAATKSEEIKKYTGMLSEVVQATVTSLNQTIVEGLKAAHEDGKLTEDEVVELKNMSKRAVLNVMGDKGVAVLHEACGDVEQYVSHLIEQAVANAKKG
jgi:hypothetical protein